MPIELTMPALSPTMEKGTLAKWLVKVGDAIRSGDVLAEIETDKATMEFEAIDEGRISALVVAEGTDNVAVGTVIALIAADSEANPPPAAAAAPVAIAVPRVAAPEPTSQPVAKPGAAVPAPASPGDDAGINATPLARRIAAASGVALRGVTGSGPGGRIRRADVLPPIPAVPSPVAAAAPAPLAVHVPPAGVPVETVKLSGMRKTIARRLSEAKQTVPHFYLTVRCRIDALLALRRDLNASLATSGVKISVNDLLVKAMAQAMLAAPGVNVQFGGDELHRFKRVDIAMAVAVAGGLVTPVIRDAGALSVSAIARRSAELATKARDGKLLPEDYQGGTASISNLGMFGIDAIVPVINPPQAMILGIGAGIEQPWKVDGAVALATILAATASFDHRAVDGATGAEFLAAFRGFVENPLTIVG